MAAGGACGPVFGAVQCVTVTAAPPPARWRLATEVVAACPRVAACAGVDGAAALALDLVAVADGGDLPPPGVALVTREDRSQVHVAGAVVRLPRERGGGCRLVCVLTAAPAPLAALRGAAWLAQAAGAPAGVLYSRAAALLALPLPLPGYSAALAAGGATVVSLTAPAVNNMPGAAVEAPSLVRLVATLLPPPVVAAAVRCLLLEQHTLLTAEPRYRALLPLVAGGLLALLAPLQYQGTFIPSPPAGLDLDTMLQAPFPCFLCAPADAVADVAPATLAAVAVIDLATATATLPGREVVCATAGGGATAGAGAGATAGGGIVVPPATASKATGGSGRSGAAALFSPFRAAAAAVAGRAAAPPPQPPPSLCASLPPWPPKVATSLSLSLSLYGDKLYRGPAAQAAVLASLLALPPPLGCDTYDSDTGVPPLLPATTPPAPAAVASVASLCGIAPAGAVGAAGGSVALPPPPRGPSAPMTPTPSTPARTFAALAGSGSTTRASRRPAPATPAGALQAAAALTDAAAGAAVEAIRKACMEAVAALIGDYDAYFVDCAAAARDDATQPGAYLGLTFDAASAAASKADLQPFIGRLLESQAWAEFLAQRLRWSAVSDAECLYFDALADAVAHRGSKRCAFLTDPALAPPQRDNALLFTWQPPPPAPASLPGAAADATPHQLASVATVAVAPYAAAYAAAHAAGDAAACAARPRRPGAARRSMFGVAAADARAGAPVALTLAAPADWSVRVHRMSMLPAAAAAGSPLPDAVRSPSGAVCSPCSPAAAATAGVKRRAPLADTSAPASPADDARTTQTPAPALTGVALTHEHARAVLALPSASKRRKLLECTLPPAPAPPLPRSPEGVTVMAMSAFTGDRAASDAATIARLRSALARSEADRMRWAAEVARSQRHMRVLVRVRPSSDTAPGGAGGTLATTPNAVLLRRPGPGGAWQSYDFDGVVGVDGSQEEVYSALEPTVLRCVTAGENGLIMAYGQTGSGKTHTMAGSWAAPADNDDALPADAGVIARTLVTLFSALRAADAEVRLSLVEIYNEELADLLAPSLPHAPGCDCGAVGCGPSAPVKIAVRQCGTAAVPRMSLVGVAAARVATAAAALALLADGTRRRATATNGINAVSSRSHMLAVVDVTRSTGGGDGTAPRMQCKLVLGDLAGSERLAAAAAAAATAAAATEALPAAAAVGGERWKESTAINLSLTTLGRVVAALSEDDGSGAQGDAPRRHLPYRDSLLTHVLSDCLGGAAHAAMLCTVSAAPDDASETAATLAFAARARAVKVRPVGGIVAGGGGRAAGEPRARDGAGAEDAAMLRMELHRRNVRIAHLEAALADARAAAAAAALPAPPAAPRATPTRTGAAAGLRARQAQTVARLAAPKSTPAAAPGADSDSDSDSDSGSDSGAENVTPLASLPLYAAAAAGGSAAGCVAGTGGLLRARHHAGTDSRDRRDGSVVAVAVPSPGPGRGPRRRVSFMPAAAAAAST